MKKLKSLCFLTFLTLVQCRQISTRRGHMGGTVSNYSVHGKPRIAADIPPVGYISHGRQARIDEFPWMCRILIKDRNDGETYSCGGSLISDRHVITAAHCMVRARYLEDIQVFVGEYNIFTNSVIDCDINNSCTISLATEPIEVGWHGDYEENSLTNDIAILKLKTDYIKSACVRPISLPTFDIEESAAHKDATLTVAGWGRTNKSLANLPEILRVTKVQLKTRPQCLKLLNFNYPSGHLCAASPAFSNVCEGDSGGPLMIFHQNKYYLSGLASMAAKACGTIPSAYYTNVFKYLNWIKNVM